MAGVAHQVVAQLLGDDGQPAQQGFVGGDGSGQAHQRPPRRIDMGRAGDR